MGRIVVTEFVSLDGVMEAPGGGEDFRHAGWTFAIDRGEEGEAFKLEETRASAALLLGRRTYEGFAAAWPSMQGEFADKLNAMPKYVVSSTLRDPAWANTTVLEGDVAESVPALKERVEGDVVVHGSAQLAQALLEQDLVDELRLMVFPVVLGTGKRLFGETSDKKPLRLARGHHGRRRGRDPRLRAGAGLSLTRAAAAAPATPAGAARPPRAAAAARPAARASRTPCARGAAGPAPPPGVTSRCSAPAGKRSPQSGQRYVAGRVPPARRTTYHRAAAKSSTARGRPPRRPG